MLTSREWEIMRLCAQGYTTEGVMHELRITRNTYYTHWHHIHAKLDVGSMVDAFRAVGWLHVEKFRDRSAR